VRIGEIVQLGRMQAERRPGKRVEVLHVIPVRVGEHDRVDVRSAQAAPPERVGQRLGSSGAARVDQDAPGPARGVLALDQGDRAERDRTLAGVEEVTLQQRVDPRRHCAYRSTCRSTRTPNGGSVSTSGTISPLRASASLPPEASRGVTLVSPGLVLTIQV
jgi:hypothetical protein